MRINFELWPVKANTQGFLKRKYFTRHGCLIRLGIAIVLMAKKKHDGWYVFLLKIPDFSLKLYFFRALFALIPIRSLIGIVLKYSSSWEFT